MSVVEVLSEQLDGRLCSIDLLLGHVHVVHEDHGFLSHGRTEETFTTLVHTRHDNELKYKTKENNKKTGLIAVTFNTYIWVVGET